MSLVFWFAFNLASLLIIILFKTTLPSDIPLYYSRIWGETRLAKNSMLFLLPVGSLLLGTFNVGIIIKFLQEEKFITRLVVVNNAVISFLSFLAVFNIITIMQ
jgi:hypothetical protein